MMRPWLCAALLLSPAWGWQALPSADEALAKIRSNMEKFEASLPNFVCREKITTSRSVYAKVVTQTVFESVFTGVQKPNDAGMTFTENREIATVDGKRARKGQRLIGPLIYTGGFSSAGNMIFSSKYKEDYHYKVAGFSSVKGRRALRIEFATREGQHDVFIEVNGRAMLLNGTGAAWFDAESFQLLRLELISPGTEGAEMATLVEYAEAQIGGQTFWMPRGVTSDEDLEKDHLRFVAEYSNYRKFDVSTGIKF